MLRAVVVMVGTAVVAAVSMLVLTGRGAGQNSCPVDV